jgi:hypothetical protein
MSDAQRPASLPKFGELVERRITGPKLIHEFFRSVLNAMTWISVCIVVVVLVWRADQTQVRANGLETVFMITNCAITFVAVATSVILIGALVFTVEGLRRDMLVFGGTLTRVLVGTLGGWLLYAVVLFALIAVGVLTLPVLDALGVATFSRFA